jgi:hypothetical protein
MHAVDGVHGLPEAFLLFVISEQIKHILVIYSLLMNQ